MLYTEGDKTRELPLRKAQSGSEGYRTEWRRGYARLIHCPSFRRLQGKTQLFPGIENDFFRNRLTHSLEVAQIAKSIAIRLNYLLKKKGLKRYQIDTDLVEFAALTHDLGHPPFGHIGEKALDNLMIDDGGFEGNAQTLRLISKIEKKVNNNDLNFGFTKSGIDKRVGLNLTYRTLASIIKYDFAIPYKKEDRIKALKDGVITNLGPVKGYYNTEKELVNNIKKNVIGINAESKQLKTIECQIMDMADDIAYSTYDLEDSFKAGFTNPLETITADEHLLSVIKDKVNSKLGHKFDINEIRTILLNIFYKLFETFEFEEGLKINEQDFKDLSFTAIQTVFDASNKIANNGYYRVEFTSELIGKYIRGTDFVSVDNEIPALSKIKINDNLLLEIETLKHFTFQSQILSPKLKVVEYRGKKIINDIFNILLEGDNYKMMPKDYYSIYENCSNSDKKRCICDFISGMTDRYAIEYYGRLTSENPETIFKPY